MINFYSCETEKDFKGSRGWFWPYFWFRRSDWKGTVEIYQYEQSLFNNVKLKLGKQFFAGRKNVDKVQVWILIWYKMRNTKLGSCGWTSFL